MNFIETPLKAKIEQQELDKWERKLGTQVKPRQKLVVKKPEPRSSLRKKNPLTIKLRQLELAQWEKNLESQLSPQEKLVIGEPMLQLNPPKELVIEEPETQLSLLQEELAKTQSLIDDALLTGRLQFKKYRPVPELGEPWSKETEENFIFAAENNRFELIRAVQKNYPGLPFVDAEDLLENAALRMIASSRNLIERSLLYMPEKHKRIILLAIFFDYTVYEIEKIVGGCEGTVCLVVGKYKNKFFNELKPTVPNFRNSHYIKRSEKFW
ncbi:MAG: hypothetical protein A2W22_04790 [Candidatus Levybacteria bacterium RBG_16_35_11]|nr:MAG: hypothetical protein A2W22_04790 [Candidatus Levybacteria bacterium RBG_16_35_11]